ncbi:MAG: hypothetical protein HY815_06400 [Candidatus Riflebacteria bacterium]|nr:hypothetical protein [Candidatus Riflebacteria bacterium]
MAALLLFISLLAICAELMFGMMLGLKTWTHMVYVVISFALLGYGVGSNLFLLCQKRLKTVDASLTLSLSLCALAITTFLSSRLIPCLPAPATQRVLDPHLWLSIAGLYLVVAAPFVSVGFALTQIFVSSPQKSGWLYFCDLVGAGLGAICFFPALAWLGPHRTLAALSFLAMIVARSILSAERRTGWLPSVLLALAVALGGACFLPEPAYVVTDDFGWECVPYRFREDQYKILLSEWHPLGRTELYQITDPQVRENLSSGGGEVGAFELNVKPVPAFCYFANSYRAGTPAYELSDEGLRRRGSRVELLSQTMEIPYLLIGRPRVLIIGTGGGRDIFMARSHGAAEITGAEVNPSTYRAMSRGGVAFDYTGGIYEAPTVRVHNCDGRHLARTRAPGSLDLVILNGVDTFASLSSGAYTFAESYLYTKEAVQDYLRCLSADGVINFNRWLEYKNPQETLRLLVTVLEALRSQGATRPWEHVIIGRERPDWSVMLVRKRPFTPDEEARVATYFEQHGAQLVLLPGGRKTLEPKNAFEGLSDAYRQGRENAFIDDYFADISPVRDDSPFFYKRFKFSLDWTLVQRAKHPAGGGPALYVQLGIFIQTLVFVGVFIFLPLMVFRRTGLTVLAAGGRPPFLLYFGSIGIGFILIEVALMQKLVLVLGSPVYSISVTLASLLVFCSLGSLAMERATGLLGGRGRLVWLLSFVIVGYLAVLETTGGAFLERLLGSSTAVRMGVCCGLLAPIGFSMGMFLPLGLRLVGTHHEASVAWALGINSGFTVLGSVVSLIIAQAFGFNATLRVAAAAYLVASAAYVWLAGAESRERPDAV